MTKNKEKQISEELVPQTETKQEIVSLPDTNAVSVSETETKFVGSEEEQSVAAENSDISQTETENKLKTENSAEDDAVAAEIIPVPQTDAETVLAAKAVMETAPRSEQKSAEESDPYRDIGKDPEVSQTDSKSKRKSGRRKKADEVSTQSEGKEEANPNDDVAATKEPEKKRASAKPMQVISIDEHCSVETEADKEKNDLLDLIESLKTGRILAGTIQGVERGSDNHSMAVIYHGAFKIVIPAEEAVEPPDDFRGQQPADVMHYLLTKRLGAEVDYIVKGIDAEACVAVASRLDAMKAKRKQYYFGTDRDGNNLLYAGQCAEARVISVIRAGIFVDLFGLEIYIPLRELSYQRLMDATGYFQPGQRILVKVLDVDRSNKNHIKASVSVKQAGENPYEKALRMYTVGNRYVGSVSMVDTNGVFVALDGGIDCLCSYPKRGRPPRGARVTVRILGINHQSNRIWGAITHIAVPR